MGGGGGITAAGLTGIVSRSVLYFSPIKTQDWGEGAQLGLPRARAAHAEAGGTRLPPSRNLGVGGTGAKLAS